MDFGRGSCIPPALYLDHGDTPSHDRESDERGFVGPVGVYMTTSPHIDYDENVVTF
jgi:hypothetical protein